MTSTTVAAESIVQLDQHEGFALFGRSESSGWLFGAHDRRVAHGEGEPEPTGRRPRCTISRVVSSMAAMWSALKAWRMPRT